MGVPTGLDYQLILLPARTAAEAAAWGRVAMEYAAKFQPVHFARDPWAVDWRGYQHVTLVRPSFWPADLPLLIKQANPQAVIDRIPVDTPDALQLVFNLRVYYDWRYGPQTPFDWSQLWPPGVALIGLHGRASGELQDPDYAIMQTARIEAVKLTSHATLATVQRLRALNPNLFILLRPMISFWTDQKPIRTITPDEFFEGTWRDVARFYDADPTIRYFELHNEPNLRLEGVSGTWSDGAEFGEWFLKVLALYRERFPEAKLGFPGLSPGTTSSPVGRIDDQAFITEALPYAQQADWVGIHSYWVNEREMADQQLGLNVLRYRQLFPEKLLFITEFGNPFQPKAEVADQYARYYGMLRRLNGLGAAFAYIVSTPDARESPLMAWRDENGRDVGIAEVVGARPYIH